MHESVPTAQNEMNYASFWERAGATLIDSIILWIGFSLLGNLFHGDTERVFFGIGYNPINLALQLLTTWLYSAFQESSLYQATLGKRIFRIKVTDRDGRRLSFIRASTRYFARLLSWLSLLIGFFIMLRDPKRQTLHDKIAQTLVIRS